jgi:hypothetical protein
MKRWNPYHKNPTGGLKVFAKMKKGRTNEIFVAHYIDQKFIELYNYIDSTEVVQWKEYVQKKTK